jgi:hypothetical protein
MRHSDKSDPVEKVRRQVRQATAPLLGILGNYVGRTDETQMYVSVGTLRKLFRDLCAAGVGQATDRFGNPTRTPST